MSGNQDLTTLLRARTPLLVIESAEEGRVIESFRHAIAQSLRPLFTWSITDGLRRIDMDDEGEQAIPDATLTLTSIKQRTEAGVFLLLDFQPYLRYPMTLRLLREIVLRQGSAEHTLVLVGSKIELPDDLGEHATRFEMALPDAQAMAALLREEAFNYSRENSGRRVEVDADSARTIVRNLAGLTHADARRIVRKLIYADGALGPADLPELAQAKFELLDRENLLHFEYETARFAEVAGLNRLKRWIQQREPAFVGRKLKVRLDPPKGILLLGVQGCGKSLAAKAVAGGFGVPLLRLDIGTLYNKYHGETERNLRAALKNAEMLSPCVLWLDEIEKALSTEGSDDGVSRRVLGYLLTWMAERKGKVFLVATANDVSALPAELLRKGRFDEIFFVDLPDAESRVEVLRIHLAKREIDAESIDIDHVASACEGFSGAEIEQLIVAAMYAASADDSALATEHLIEEVRLTRPLSVMMADRVSALREWARDRTVPAD
ncbi:AAA family ATPase [Dokdonella sp.]|uniref:AAA family ATPase n=1 Tax=Dokdonella sp. TaxID=2291710 RepID=UPI0035296B7C